MANAQATTDFNEQAGQTTQTMNPMGTGSDGTPVTQQQWVGANADLCAKLGAEAYFTAFYDYLTTIMPAPQASSNVIQLDDQTTDNIEGKADIGDSKAAEN